MPLYVTTLKTAIDGTVSLPKEAYAGEPLSVDLSALKPADAAVTYQWYADGVAVKEATGSTYVVKPSDVGKSIFVRVFGTGKYDGFLDSNPVKIKEGTAEDHAPQIVLSGAGAAQGNTFTAQISVRNNPGFNALNLAVVYDSNILTLVDVENLATELTLTKGASYFLDSADNYCENGGLLQLTFKVSEDVPAGDYELQLKFLGASNENFEEVKMAAFAGEQVSVDIMLEDNPGVSALDLYYVYDKTNLTLKGADYTISDLAYGTYTVKVRKNNHVTRTYTVCVDSDVAKLDMKICLLGDVTGDGRVNVGDTAKLYSHIRKTAILTDEYQLLCANVNGGSLNVGDGAGIYSHVRGTKKLY